MSRLVLCCGWGRAELRCTRSCGKERTLKKSWVWSKDGSKTLVAYCLVQLQTWSHCSKSLRLAATRTHTYTHVYAIISYNRKDLQYIVWCFLCFRRHMVRWSADVRVWSAWQSCSSPSTKTSRLVCPLSSACSWLRWLWLWAPLKTRWLYCMRVILSKLKKLSSGNSLWYKVFPGTYMYCIYKCKAGCCRALSKTILRS